MEMFWSGPYMSAYMWMFPLLGSLVFITTFLFLVQFISGPGPKVKTKDLEEELGALKKELRTLKEEIKAIKKAA